MTSAIPVRCSTNKLTLLPMCGFIAQLVEHRTGIAEVMGSNPVEALIFFRLPLSNCLNWKIYCDDQISLPFDTSVICHVLVYSFGSFLLQIVSIRVISQTTDSHFANYRFSFRKLQIFISQTTDFHFANYRFSFRFVPFRFAPFRFANYSNYLASILELPWAADALSRSCHFFGC